MKYENFLENKSVRSLKRFNEYYAFAMVALFSFMPIMAIFDPQSFGPIFTTLAYLEIIALAVLGAFQLISYSSFESRVYSTSDRMKACFLNFKRALLKNKPASLLIVVYCLGFIAALLAEDTTRSMVGTEFRPDGVLMYSCFLSLFVFSALIKKKNLRKAIFVINIVGCIFCSLIVVQQYYGIIGSAGVKEAGAFGKYMSEVYDSYGIRYGHFFKGLTGPFYNLNHVAYYIAVCAMLASSMYITAEKLSSKIIWAIVSAFLFYTMILNDTFGCYLAIFGALIIVPMLAVIKMQARSFKKIINNFVPLILFVAISVGFFALNSSDNSILNNFTTLGKDVNKITTTEDITQEHAGSGRLEMWLATVDMIKERPVNGYGADNLKPHYVEREVQLDRAHNEPLEFAVAMGIPAAVIYYVAIAGILFLFLKRKNKNDLALNKGLFEREESLAPMMAAIGYLISSLFGVFLFYTGGYFLIMLGMVAASANEEA